MNASLAYANIVIHGLEDGSTARDAARAFDEAYQRAQDPNARRRAEAAARLQKKREASFKRLEKWAYDRLAKRRAREAAQRAKQLATSGSGWRSCPGPTPDVELERLFKDALDLVFTGTPWPPDVRVGWGELDAPNPQQRTLAAYIPAARRIVVDRRHLKSQSVSDLLETAVHEIVHLIYREHPAEHHGEGFQRTLARALQVLNDLAAPAPVAAIAAAPLAAASAAGRPPLTPPTGVRWGRGGWYPAPGLEPDLEYRG